MAAYKRASEGLCDGPGRDLALSGIGLDQPDDSPLGIGEPAEREPDAGDLGRPEQARAAEFVGLHQRGLDVGNANVESDQAIGARLSLADVAADPDAVLAEVVLTSDGGVAERVVEIDLPTEQLREKARELRPILAGDFEVNDRIPMVMFLSRRMSGSVSAGATFILTPAPRCTLAYRGAACRRRAPASVRAISVSFPANAVTTNGGA